MAKRSTGQFERIPNDLYRTWDPRAVKALLPHLAPGTRFVEPCAGHGDLIDQLVNAGHDCVGAFDIDPGRGDIKRGDATTLTWKTMTGVFVSNPPWSRHLLHPIIKALAYQAPTWLLYDSDWLFTGQADPYLPYLRKVVTVGRLKWIPGSPDDGKDNVCWYLFDATRPFSDNLEFIGRR